MAQTQDTIKIESPSGEFFEVYMRSETIAFDGSEISFSRAVEIVELYNSTPKRASHAPESNDTLFMRLALTRNSAAMDMYLFKEPDDDSIINHTQLGVVIKLYEGGELAGLNIPEPGGVRATYARRVIEDMQYALRRVGVL